MGIFNWGKDASETVEAIGGAVTGTIESLNYALSGDLPPDVRVKLEEVKLKMEEFDSKIKDNQFKLTMKESESPSFFKSGWRPMLAWVGVTGFSLVFVLFPIFEWILNIVIVFNKIELTPQQLMALKPPSIDGWLLLNLLGALLGIGTLRSYEKGKGITK